MDFPGAVNTALFGINNAGQIVDACADAAIGTRGFLLMGGVLTPIDFPGGANGSAWVQLKG